MLKQLPGPRVKCKSKNPGTRTCGCGVQYQADRHSPRACPACLKQRDDAKAAAQAARPFSTCRKCGDTTQDCSLLGDCAACRATRRSECAAERERVSQEHQRKREQKQTTGHRQHGKPLPKKVDLSHLAEGAIVAHYVIRGGYPKQHNGGAM